MGPNLSRLFGEAKSKDYLAAPKAQHKLDLLLMTHGEALVERLETMLDYAKYSGDVTEIQKAINLLDTLEREAGE